MEFVILAFLFTVVPVSIANLLMLRRLTHRLAETRLTLVAVDVASSCEPLDSEEVPSLPSITATPPPKEMTSEDKDAYHAWKNHIEEPVRAPPSPHGPPPTPGPLERPYGFSR